MQHPFGKLYDSQNKTSTVSDQLCSTSKTKKQVNQDNRIDTFESHYQSELKEFERQADIQLKEGELNHCVEFVSQLVDLFKHSIIIPALQMHTEWHHDHGHQLKRNSGITGNNFLDDRTQQIAIEKGLTKEQWRRLLYLNFTANDGLEMVNVSRNHLKKVHDMASRLLEKEEQETVFALIDAITKHMPESCFTDR